MRAERLARSGCGRSRSASRATTARRRSTRGSCCWFWVLDRLWFGWSSLLRGGFRSSADISEGRKRRSISKLFLPQCLLFFVTDCSLFFIGYRCGSPWPGRGDLKVVARQPPASPYLTSKEMLALAGGISSGVMQD